MSSQQAIDERYFYLQLHYTELMSKCINASQQQTVAHEFTDASTCRDLALERTFDENAAAVASTRESLRSSTAALAAQMAGDSQIVVILDTLTAGGDLAEALVGLGH